MLKDLITFTSDFGYSEEWVAAVKGVILTINPSAAIVDISHQIPPFDIGKGAFVLAAALPYLPVAVHTVSYTHLTLPTN